eukprot:4031314-Pleurochrysis_carterae.AAC.1
MLLPGEKEAFHRCTDVEAELRRSVHHKELKHNKLHRAEAESRVNDGGEGGGLETKDEVEGHLLTRPRVSTIRIDAKLSHLVVLFKEGGSGVNGCAVPLGGTVGGTLRSRDESIHSFVAKNCPEAFFEHSMTCSGSRNFQVYLLHRNPASHTPLQLARPITRSSSSSLALYRIYQPPSVF